MTRYLLAGGGTAGHVNPLLAVADRLRRDDPSSEVLVLGTASGLEVELVPDRGYELVTIGKVPLPRRMGKDVLRFPGRFFRAIRHIRRVIRERKIDVLVGFGGYVSAPAYVAAWREKLPVVVHEANAVPGFANRVGARLTRFVGVAFAGTNLRNARVVGMPLSETLEALQPAELRHEALTFFGFDPDKPVLLVTGGSLGARTINDTVSTMVSEIHNCGWSVLHIVGARSELAEQVHPHYRVMKFCDRMDLAFSAGSLAIARAGSATVSELTALGIPAVYVPLPIGNGEQQQNALEVRDAGGAIIVDNSLFTPEWIRHSFLPLLKDRSTIEDMASKTARQGKRDGTANTVALIADALASSKVSTVD